MKKSSVFRYLVCVLLVVLAGSVRVFAEEEPTDSLGFEADPIALETGTDSLAAEPRSSTRWIKQLWENKFHINDPSIDYPRFPNFLRKVYNWGDKTFNSYDSTYVVPTGKNWKLLWKSYNWANSYMMIFPERQSVWMQSDMNADIGASLCFMAVSVGYTFNANDFLKNNNTKRRNFNFNFTCALFSGDINYSSTDGGVKIRKFGKFNNGHHVDIPMDNVTNKTLTAKLFYFFNHKKYSHAAAYCYSKYQLKSSGTWIAGLSTARQEIGIDFSTLPPDILDNIPALTLDYRFHYRDYNIIGGYAHNWVLHPRRWLINLTVLPSIGYKHTYEDATVGKRDMFSTNMNVNFSVVYNHRALFCAVNGRFDGFLYFTKDFTFMNSQESLLATVGMRF